MGRTRLTKTLQYRDQTGASQAAHVAHWEGFTWQAGPVIVAAEGPWGCCKVWAASETEGKRVIRHAASIAGWDPDTDPKGRWIVTSSSDPRFGKRGTMAVRLKDGYPMISKRDGPNGQPLGYTLGP